MSFATDTKQELLREISFRRSCCRQAFCAGLLFCATEEDGRICIRVTGKSNAEAIGNILSKQYGRMPEIACEKRFGSEHCKVFLSFPSAVRLVGQSIDLDCPISEIVSFRCEFCRGHFYRAVFLTVGTVSDPERENYLEFLLPDAGRAAKLYTLLSEEGVQMKPINRRNGCGLYLRSGGGVEDVFRLMEANQKLFDLLNVRISKEISNQENRATNCVTRNIQKTVSASLRQTAAVEKLMACGGLERLSPELKATALLRMQHADVSLEELAAMHCPPISKSGLNHRLRRIIQEAETLHSENIGR